MTSSDETELQPGVDDRTRQYVHQILRGELTAPAGHGVRFGVVCAEFNGGITERLLHGVLEGLSEGGVKAEDIDIAWVPGAFELPVASLRFAISNSVSAVIALGAVIRGDTAHFDFVAGQCAEGLLRVSLDTGIPVIFGVLTVDTVEQALVRSLSDKTNKGKEAAQTALSMVNLLPQIDEVSPEGFAEELP